MRVISFAFWLVVGWLWLMVVSLLVGALIAYTINEFLLAASTPVAVGYLVSGLATFAAAMIALFSAGRSRRFGTGVLVATLCLGVIDLVLVLLTVLGLETPRIGYTAVLAGHASGPGAQLVSGVGLLAACGVFLYSRYLASAEARTRGGGGGEPEGRTDAETPRPDTGGDASAHRAT